MTESLDAALPVLKSPRNGNIIVTIESTREYYGTTLQGSADLRTDACCTMEAPPPAIGRALANVHDEIRSRYYGCGLIAPDAIEGARILDLGSGSGQDSYVLAQLVGEHGEVVGVDATEAQLAVASRHVEWHRRQFGYAAANTSFVAGDIERLDALELAPGSFDVIVSNCVINLVSDKAAVFRAARRLLKPGGELYFSDVYADRRPPASLRDDPVLHGECLAGALYWNDFLSIAKASGFADPRLVGSRVLEIRDAAVSAKVGAIRFFSATYRLFALDELEPACEDYGQAVRYRGTVAGSPDAFRLDGHHLIETGRVFPVCGNTWRMLAETRFAPHFDLLDGGGRHLGIFPGCGTNLPFDVSGGAGASGGCC